MSKFLESIGALFSHGYVQRTKTCKYCGTVFCDVTERNLQRTCCKKCMYALMVATRKSNGSYTPTTEQNRKKSETLKELYASGKRVITDHQRKVSSETMKKTWEEGRIDTANHWSRTEQGKKRISEAGTGRFHSEATRRNMSLSQQKRIRTRRETYYTSAHGGTRQDLGMYFRSNWEANFARILNYQDRKWEYEPQTFQVDNSTSYTPDFYLVDECKFYELKGRMDDRSRLKLDLMKEKFPMVTIELIEGKEYDLLRKEFKHLVAWEGK